MEHESHHHHHPHKTGVRWLDLMLGVSAAVVSLVSLWLALHSAHSMEKLVMANSYPYVEMSRSNRTLERNPASGAYSRKIDYQLTNNGVGPARIEWVRLEFKGKPMADLGALLDACCKLPKYDTNGLNQRGEVSGTLIPQGREFHMFTWEAPLTSNPTFDALHRQMDDISVSTCYCSVFDECYVREWTGKKPKPVEQCTAPPIRFEPRVERG